MCMNTKSNDEYGQRANGVLSSLDKFDSVFGLKLGYLLFGATEQHSRTLQGKNTTLQEAITAANLAKNHYTRLRTEHFTSHVSPFQNRSGEPVLPRYRKTPSLRSKRFRKVFRTFEAFFVF